MRMVFNKAKPNIKNRLMLPPPESVSWFTGSTGFGSAATVSEMDDSSLSGGCALSDVSRVIETDMSGKADGSKLIELPLSSNNVTPETDQI